MPNDKKQLVTNLTGDLNDQEINLLAKGPKFSLANVIDDNTIHDLHTSFYRMANSIRWQAHRESTQNQQQITLQAYPKSNYITKTRKHPRTRTNPQQDAPTLPTNSEVHPT